VARKNFSTSSSGAEGPNARVWPIGGGSCRSGVKTIPRLARSPNLKPLQNVGSIRQRVRSAKDSCVSKLIVFGQGPPLRILAEFSARYHGERNHHGKGSKLLFPFGGQSEPPSFGGRDAAWNHSSFKDRIAAKYSSTPGGLTR
jgi:hypothetical protein